MYQCHRRQFTVGDPLLLLGPLLYVWLQLVQRIARRQTAALERSDTSVVEPTRLEHLNLSVVFDQRGPFDERGFIKRK